jgi:ABC-type Fe3+-hydroxamate transport system substrate-binding protein
MKTSRFFVSTLVVLISSVLLSACLSQSSNVPAPSAAPNTSLDKSGTTTLRGTLQVQGKAAVLISPTGNIPLESYELTFADYAGKTVTVEGKYSGDTLFVNSITADSAE